MFGLFGLLIALWATIALISYWISWDLQPCQTRGSFVPQMLVDLARLFAKFRDPVGDTGMIRLTNPRRRTE